MSILNVNKINPVGGGSTITIAGIASVTSSVTAPSFVGAVTGNVTGNADTASGLSGNPSINTTGIVTATSFVPTVGQLSHRNIIVNGDMRIAQRGTSSTSTGYQTVDRIETQFSGTDENATQAQVDVASGTTPYTLGFRKAYKITNGNQTSGVGATDNMYFRYKPESQDIANSGWNYNSASSFITVSFWVKSSVAQGFQFTFRTDDGTSYIYIMETGSLTANTWTKVTKTIPGNANLTINNDNGEGPQLLFVLYSGTDYTSNSATADAWQAYASGILFGRDSTSTWYTTNDATLEFTGLQLEVGSVATPFEHRSRADELRRCQRYCYVIPYGANSANTLFIENVYGDTKSSSEIQAQVTFPAPMRTKPTYTGSSTNVELFAENGSDHFTLDGFSDYLTYGGEGCNSYSLRKSSASGITAGQSGKFLFRATGGFMKFEAEL